MKKFKILSRKLVLDNQYLPVEKQIVELPNGEEAEWFVALVSDAVLILPQLENGKFLLQKNYKHGSGENVIEFCAGMVDKGENPKETASRELLEETGFECEEMIKIGENFSNPTGSAMKYHYFLAKNCRKTAEPELEAAEQIEVFEVENLKKISELLTNKDTKTSSATISALKYAEMYLE